jgi:hypothetical protein
LTRSKVLFYELKRAILSKPYVFLLLLVGVFSFYTLKTSVLRGFADTAPFSEWTFMSYLFSIVPFLSAIALFFTSRLFSPYEKNVMHIVSAVPFSRPLYLLIRLAVITLAWAVAALLSITACLVFYRVVFGATIFRSFAICVLLAIVSPLLLLQGAGLWLSRWRPNLAIVLIALVFFAGFARFSPPYWLDVLGRSIMQVPQEAMPLKGVIAFVVPRGFLVSRLILCALGIILMAAGCFRLKLAATR